jgi:hypothetical protein
VEGILVGSINIDFPSGRERFTMATGDSNAQGQSTGQKIIGGVNDATELIGTLVPTIGAIGGIVRLIATAVRPTDAQKAQAFDQAIAEYDIAKGALDTAVEGFEAAKLEAEKRKAASAAPSQD